MPSFRCRAILFDMDGTLVDSTACVEAIWSRWCARHDLELQPVLAATHGRRTSDSLRELAPHLDIAAEVQRLDAEELECREGIVEVPGAAALLACLPADRWTVVTSAGRELARLRLTLANLPVPPMLVTSDDVTIGKPNPAGYLQAAQRLGFPPGGCLVVEDTPAGIQAGLAAQMQVLALTTTFPASELLPAAAVANFQRAHATFDGEWIRLHLTS